MPAWLSAYGPLLLTVVGLVFDIAGAWVLGKSLLMSREQAEELSRTAYGGNPLVLAEHLTQARRAKWGFALLIIGFVLQGVGAYLGFTPRT